MFSSNTQVWCRSREKHAKIHVVFNNLKSLTLPWRLLRKTPVISISPRQREKLMIRHIAQHKKSLRVEDMSIFDVCVPVDKCAGDDNEVRLMRHLMTSYDPAVRPAENSSMPLTIIFGVSLHHIIDVVSASDCSGKIVVKMNFVWSLKFVMTMRRKSGDFPININKFTTVICWKSISALCIAILFQLKLN